VILRLMCVVLATFHIVVLSSCNESPTDLGANLGPGVDSLYALSSIDSTSLLTKVSTVKRQLPFFNSTFFFLGRAEGAEARAFIEFINYPKLGDPNAWEVVSSDLLLTPAEYRFGDTANTTFAFDAFELERLWAPTITWDSIWNASDMSTFYSPSSKRVSSFSGSITPQDSIVSVPFDVASTKDWLIRGIDSTLRQSLFGVVIVPTATSHVRLFRNSEGSKQILRLRVVTKHRDSAEPDTTLLESAVACFVNTPEPSPNTLVAQGATQLRVACDVSVASIPRNAVILDAALTLTVEPSASVDGSFGPDDVLRVGIVPPGGTTPTIYQARRDGVTDQYIFRNIAGSLQAVLRSADSTTRIEVYPDDFREFWRINRTAFHGLSADPDKRPRLTLVYTIPRLHP